MKLRDIEAQTVGPGRNRKVETGDALGLLVEQQKGPEGHRKNGAKEHEHAGKAEAQAPANRQVAHEPSHAAHHFTIPVKSAVSPFSSKCRENSCPTATGLFDP